MRFRVCVLVVTGFALFLYEIQPAVAAADRQSGYSEGRKQVRVTCAGGGGSAAGTLDSRTADGNVNKR